MVKHGGLTAGGLAIALAVQLRTVHAAGLDPVSGTPGWLGPFDVDVLRAEAIVIGRVPAEQGPQEDSAEPDGYTAWNTIIRVLDSPKQAGKDRRPSARRQ